MNIEGDALCERPQYETGKNLHHKELRLLRKMEELMPDARHCELASCMLHGDSPENVEAELVRMPEEAAIKKQQSRSRLPGALLLQPMLESVTPQCQSVQLTQHRQSGPFFESECASRIEAQRRGRDRDAGIAETDEAGVEGGVPERGQ